MSYTLIFAFAASALASVPVIYYCCCKKKKNKLRIDDFDTIELQQQAFLLQELDYSDDQHMPIQLREKTYAEEQKQKKSHVSKQLQNLSRPKCYIIQNYPRASYLNWNFEEEIIKKLGIEPISFISERKLLYATHAGFNQKVLEISQDLQEEKIVFVRNRSIHYDRNSIEELLSYKSQISIRCSLFLPKVRYSLFVLKDIEIYLYIESFEANRNPSNFLDSNFNEPIITDTKKIKNYLKLESNSFLIQKKTISNEKPKISLIYLHELEESMLPTFIDVEKKIYPMHPEKIFYIRNNTYAEPIKIIRFTENTDKQQDGMLNFNSSQNIKILWQNNEKDFHDAYKKYKKWLKLMVSSSVDKTKASSIECDMFKTIYKRAIQNKIEYCIDCWGDYLKMHLISINTLLTHTKELALFTVLINRYKFIYFKIKEKNNEIYYLILTTSQPKGDNLCFDKRVVFDYTENLLYPEFKLVDYNQAPVIPYKKFDTKFGFYKEYFEFPNYYYVKLTDYNYFQEWEECFLKLFKSYDATATKLTKVATKLVMQHSAIFKNLLKVEPSIKRFDTWTNEICKLMDTERDLQEAGCKEVQSTQKLQM